MTDESTRCSPIHSWLEARSPTWNVLDGMPIAVRLKDEEAEEAAIQTLALCDLSALTQIGFKGPHAESWLSDQGIDVPSAIYESRRLDGGLIVRLAADEFLLETVGRAASAPATEQNGTQGVGLTRVIREESTFLLVGSRAQDVLSQTCGVDFRAAPLQRLVLTRVAGVSCGVIPDPINGVWSCRLWVDYTYAIYLWETLVQICEELGGSVVGAGVFYPELR